MHVTSLDWVIVVVSIVVSFLPAVFLMRRAGRNTAEFFDLAAAKIAYVVLCWPNGMTLLICELLNVAFAATWGLWGVLVTDFIQFGIAMTGSFAAAYFALKQPEVGGLSGLFQRIDPK